MDAKNEVERLNLNSRIPRIKIRVHSPNVYNSFLRDNPGLFVYSELDPDLPKSIEKMSTDSLKDPNTIPLLVLTAANDPANSTALQLVNQYGRARDTIGLITKLDLTEKQTTVVIEKMLKGEMYPLGYNYVGLVLRNKNDIENGMSALEKMKEEDEFFREKPNLTPNGLDTAARKISDIQFEHIRESIPDLINDIDKTITKLKESENFLTRLVNDPNKKLSLRLKNLVEDMVSSSPGRSVLEYELKIKFKETIGQFIQKAIGEQQTFVPEFTNSSTDKSIIKFLSSRRSKSLDYEYDHFKELFSHGLISPILADSESIRYAFEREVNLATSMSLIDVVTDDKQGRKRYSWNKYLKKFFSTLQANDKIQEMIYDITQEKILEFIFNNPEGVDELTKKFAEYLVGEIGSEAYDEGGMRFAITATLNNQKRPSVKLIELVRQISQIFRDHFRFEGNMFEWLRKNDKKLKLEVYSEVWNVVYLKAMADEITEDVYQIVAVTLLDKMVEKLLEMTIDMFNKENALKEQNKVNDKIKELKELRYIISKFITH